MTVFVVMTCDRLDETQPSSVFRTKEEAEKEAERAGYEIDVDFAWVREVEFFDE